MMFWKNQKTLSVLERIAASILLGCLMVVVGMNVLDKWLRPHSVHAQVQGGVQFVPSGGQPQLQANPTNNANGAINGATGSNGITTTATQTMIAAQGANTYVWIRSASCVSSSSTATVATLLNGSTAKWTIPCVPSAGASLPIVIDPPIRWPANTPVGMAINVSVTSVWLNVSGEVTNAGF